MLQNGSVSTTISQDPNNKSSITILRSENEKDGIEFTWSVWLYLNGFQDSDSYHHVFNKGNTTIETIFYRLNSSVPNKSPLLLLPPSNGEGLVYKKLAKLLDWEFEIWTIDYQKGDSVHKVDIQAYAKELAIIWRQEQGSRRCLIGGYSLGFRVAYHMALQMEHRIDKMINVDGILYKNKVDEELINQVFIETEKSKFENKINDVLKDTLRNDINLKRWFINDYFINTINVEIQHFIGKESIVMNYVPDFVSSRNNIYTIEGNHENVLEIESNLEFIVRKII